MHTVQSISRVIAHLLHRSHALLTLDLSFASRLLFAGRLFSPPKLGSDALTTFSVSLVELSHVTGPQSDDPRRKGAPFVLPSIVDAGPGKTGVVSSLAEGWKIIRVTRGGSVDWRRLDASAASGANAWGGSFPYLQFLNNVNGGKGKGTGL